LRELRSIAAVVCSLTAIKPPSRDMKRKLPLIVQWFRDSWSEIVPWLPFIQLRDETGCPIDGCRELFERSIAFL
jgi:hypothetical protein